MLVFGGQAVAQVATDVQCAACVGTDDLAADSVTTNKIANGGVRNVDLGANSVSSGKIKDGNVTSAKLAADAVTGEKVLDNSLTGADIDEYSLQSVRTSMGGHVSSEVATLPACSNGLRYMGVQLVGGKAGQVLLNASFTAGTGTNFAAPFGIAARLERESPTVLIGEWQESHFGSGGASRSNIAVTQVFPYEENGGTYALRVCDASDSAGGVTLRGQLNWTYTPTPVPGT
jgi:hypothetical protein